MKKLFMLILTVMLLVSCSTPSKNDSRITNNQNTQTSPKFTINDYFPFKKNVKYVYTGTGNENAQREVYADYVKDDRIQLRIISPTLTTGQVYEVKNGEVRLITSQNDFNYLNDLTSQQNENPEVILKEPLEKGTSWTLSDGRKRYISGVDVKVKTSFGDYKTIEVTTEGKDETRLDYYAANIGLVKSIYEAKNSHTETILEKTEDNVSLTQTVKFYYPDFLNGNIVFTKDKIQLSTNSDIGKIFEEHFKTSPDKDITNPISPNTKINKLYLNSSEHRVYLDLSKEFINEMNAGAGLEADIIQSITNTLGDYFNVDKVYISIDGKPYESGHIAISEKDSFHVDYNNVKEYKK